MSKYLGRDTRSIQKSIVEHVEYTLAMTRFDFSQQGCFQGVAYSLRDRAAESCNDTERFMQNQDAKRIMLISPDYSLGKLAPMYLLNNDLESNYKTALQELDFKLEQVLEEETDFDIGTGPTFDLSPSPIWLSTEVRGSLSANYLDSIATFNLPSVSYGFHHTERAAKQCLY